MALAGVIAPTFLYEFGVLVVLKGRLKMTLQWLVVLGVVSVFPVFVAALTALARGGINGLLLSTSALRQTYHSGWLNDVGLLMVVCFFAASYSGFSERWRRLLVPTCLLIAVTTLSRATAVALAMGLYLSAVLEKRRRWNELVLLGVGLMVVCLVFAGRSKVEGSSLYRTLLLRLSRWAAGLDVWVKSPWLGLGLRSFTEGVAEYVNPFSGVETSMGSAHNDYVDLLVRGGVSYVALFAVLISVWLYTLLKGAQRSRVDRLCIIVLLIILSASLVHNPLKYGIMSSMFWLFKGIGIAEHKRMLAEVKQERAVRRQPRPVSTLETKSQG
jgi:O-antigen ligase